VSGLLADLAVYVAQDCSVYKEDVISLCTTNPAVPTTQDVVIHDFHIVGKYPTLILAYPDSVADPGGFIPDPGSGSEYLFIPDLGSRIPDLGSRILVLCKKKG
jgi:hypothetical protein